MDSNNGQKICNRKDRFELLVLSEAGKPIYSFSKREDAVTLVPLCSALMNYALKAQKETLVSMKTSDNLMINFTTRPPLIIIVIHEANSYVDSMVLVEQVEAQIISILTAKILRSVFEDRPTFDLKRLLYGSEKLIDSIANISVSVRKLEWPWVQAFLAVTASSDSNLQLSSTTANQIPSSNSYLPSRPHRVLIPIVSMPPSTRETIHSSIISAISANSKNIVFSLLFRVIQPTREGEAIDDQNIIDSLDEEEEDSHINDVSFQLITVCNHHNKYRLKITDIHIVLALLNGSKSQLASVESLWMPVCLPRFNEDAFLHSYISYTNNISNCLVVLSVDRDEFTNCQNARNVIEKKLDTLLSDTNHKSKLFYQMSPLVHPVLLELQDKLMSSLSADELAAAQQQAQIYNSKLELFHARQLQFLWYQTSRQVLWWQRSSHKSLSPILYYVTKKMLQSSLKTLWLKLADDSIFLGWHVPTFQLYTQFDNTITTNEATEVIQRITNWVKKEEDNFSIKDYR